jgi:hypothetical protein
MDLHKTLHECQLPMTTLMFAFSNTNTVTMWTSIVQAAQVTSNAGF